MTEFEQDIQKHFGPWPNEKCWKIKETRPIKIHVEKSWTGNGYTLKPEPMAMEYRTFEDLDMSHRHDLIRVSGSSYDYETGQAIFTADSKEDIEKWAEKYRDIITL